MKEDIRKSSDIIRDMARIGWSGRIRGDSLRRNSLLFPLNEIFNQLQRNLEYLDLDTQKAAIAQQLFDYLERIADSNYAPGAKRHSEIDKFTVLFFDELLGKIYQNNQQSILMDEKYIKAAYHFYIRAEIPQKEKIK